MLAISITLVYLSQWFNFGRVSCSDGESGKIRPTNYVSTYMCVGIQKVFLLFSVIVQVFTDLSPYHKAVRGALILLFIVLHYAYLFVVFESL